MNTKLRQIVKELKGIAIIVFVMFMIKDFLYQGCIVPSCSMYNTYLIGDVYLAEKWRIGYTNSSFSLFRLLYNWFGVTVFDGRVLASKKIEPGMTVVIHGKKGMYADKLILKRVIATEGQKVKIFRGDVFIDGEKLKKENIEIVEIVDKDGKQVGMIQKEIIKETSYKIMKQDLSGLSEMDNMEFTVPKSHVFVLGDNRDKSADSRVVGCIHENDIIGVGTLRIASIDTTQIKTPSKFFRWNRFFTKIV